MPRLAIIGAGAAGLIAAISAAQKGAEVYLFEATDRVGSKILATGNGRCNLTNMHVNPQAYNAPAFVSPALKNYTPKHIRLAFEQMGLLTHIEDEGRVYPLSNTATSVLDVLRHSCERYNVTIATNFEADVITKTATTFLVGSKRGKTFEANKVLVTTGGGSSLLASCGHTIMPFSPVLCALQTQTDPLRGLSGVRARAHVRLYSSSACGGRLLAQETGEVLFRDYGLSGIVIFNMSRLAEKGNVISLDFFPELELVDFIKKLQKRIDVLAHYSDDKLLQSQPPTYEELLCGMFHSRIAAAILRNAHLKPSALARDDACEKLARVCKDFRVEVQGFGNVKNAQVVRGGALVDEFDSNTLESRKVAGLYAAGEVLNVDGKCGGYNLHWAWASGLVAARSASKG